MKQFYRPLLATVLALCTSMVSIDTYGQCAYLASQGAAATPACPGSTTGTINPGEYVAVNVVAGNTYTFSVCGNTTCDTQLTLFDNGGTTNLGYNDDGCGLQSSITWVATYTGVVNIQLNTYNCGTTGGTCNNTVVDITCASGGGGGGPANDDPCGAIPLPVGTACTFSTYNNTGATTTTGVPAPGCASYAGEDVWFSATVPASGAITFDSNTGSITDAGMAVYSASSCSGAMTLLGCDDDGSANGLMPELTVSGLTPGATVYVMFWDYGGGTGTFDLCAYEYTPPPPPAGCNGNAAAGDLCTISTPICDLNGYCGNTSAQYGAQVITPFCGSIENNSWLSFTADATTVNLTVDVTNCTSGSGIQFGLYSTPDCANFTYATGSAATSCYSPIDGTGNAITFTPLVVGTTYYLMVDGFAGAVCDYQITANSGIVLPVNVGADITICDGDNATLTATGGNGSYTWNTGATTGSITVSPSVTTTYWAESTGGSVNCPLSESDTVVVTVNPIPTVTVSSDVTICQGGTGTTLTAGGATNYTWTPTTGLSASTGASVTATPATTTTYTVTGDAGGCSNTATVTVTVIPPPPVTVTPAAPTICFGGSTTLTASGGTSYVWSPSAGLSATTGTTVTANPAATTVYTVTSSNPGCPDVTTTVTVTVEPQIVPNFSIAGTQCLTGNSITLTSNGTVGTYDWSFTGGPANQTGSPVTVSWAAAGTYNATLTVTIGACTETLTQSISIYADPTVTANATDVSCNGAADGTISATGSTTGSYSWSSGQTGAGPHTVGPGTYTVTFTDLNGCSGTDVVTVTEPAPLVVTASAIDVNCTGLCDGTVSAAAATGGTGPYTYNWDNGLGAGQSINGTVCPGTYTVTATDANSCTTTATVTVSAPPALTVSTSAADVSCNGVCDGDVGATAAGGTGPYTYTWNGGLGAGQNFTGVVCAGTYSVTATDANGCTATGNATVGTPTLLTVTAGGTNADCNGVASGSVNATAAGGTTAYSYNWDNGLGGGSSHTNVAAGTYTVTVTDANGCTATDTYVVTEPPLLTASATGNDASCNGVCDGDATAVGAGGTGPYTYQWDAAGGLASTALTSNICAGTANVTVTDANGCTAVASVTINEPALLTVTTSSADASCNGVCDGDVGATPAGGTGPYTYTWDNGLGAGQNHTGVVCAGTYNVTVTDANGCTATASATVNEPALLTATAAGTDALCNGTCDGSVTSTGAGGVGPYSYSWDNGIGAGQNHPGTICAGTYTVTVTDNNGCTATATVTINEPSTVTVAITSADASCNGVCDGSAGATAAGGTGPYTYAWDNGLGSGSNHTGTVCAGTYNVTVTDANGCTAIGTATVNEPTLLTVAMSGNDASCNGICDGDATATPAGGTAPYTYQWDAAGGFATTATSSLLCAGTPGVTITDANGCTVVNTFTVNEPTAIALVTSSNPATCGNPDGDATVAASGGTPGYTYQWDANAANQTGTTATALLAGGYTVTVTDANGCTATAVATVNDAGAPTATITASSDVSCNGGNDGSATVLPTGGTAPYTIIWSPSGGTGLTATGLPADTYTVTVTDANGCVATATVVITEPSLLNAAIVTSSNATCNGICDASATVSASGGIGPHSYLWDNGAGSSATATGLCAGTTYTVTITDANGCAIQTSFTPTEPPVLTAAIAGTDASCNGVCDGAADLTAGGGTAPYSYAWDNAAVSEDLTNLCAGTYNVTVTDANGCTAVASVTINEPTPIALTPSSTNSNCGASDGQACIAPAGGTPGYTYLWNDISASTTPCADNVPAGSYQVIVNDANLCADTLVVTVSDNAGGSATTTLVNDVSCNGICDGSATANTIGGNGPFTFLWSSGTNPTDQTVTGLCAGTHSVDITDVNGCITSATVVINEPPAIAAAITATTDATCNGVCDGTATVTASGGTPPYTYNWTSGGTNGNETGLCAGTHDVTVTDANGCQITVTATISEPAALTATIVGTDPLCNGGCDGSADLTVGGGTGPYSYLWSNGDSSEDPAGLCAGSFDVTVTDANGCTVVANVVLNDPPAITLSTVPTDANCGQADGQVCVTAAGGTGAFTYLWNDGQTTACAVGLPAGSYDVTVTDANGCTATISDVVNDVPGGTANAVVDNNVTVNGGSDGQATASMTGGVGPFTYLWDANAGNQTTATATNLAAGNYCVDITDANGCVSTACITITEPGALIVTGVTTDLLCFGDCLGAIDVTVNGGIPPYTYVWNTSATAEDLTNQCAGSYDITVTDANGAIGTAAFVLTEPPALNITNTSVIHSSCAGSCNGSADVVVVGGTGAYTYSWVDNGTSAVIATTSNITALCAGSYTVTVTDANGCTTTATVTVNEPGPIALVSSTTNANCGQADGSVNVSASGGTGTFVTYEWYDSNPNLVGSTPMVGGLPAGTYTVTVTDNNGCQQNDTIAIMDNSAGTAATNIVQNVSCNGVCDGSATVTMTGGTAPFTYLWNSGANPTDQNVTGLCAGTWTVDVTDASGCVASTTVTVTEPAVLAVSTTGTDASCNGASDGTLSAITTGGTAGFTYNWVDDNTTLTVGTNVNETGLPAGSYTVNVTDANGCTTSATQIISEPTAIVLTTSSTDASCGQSDGSVTVSAAGGSGVYVSYDWDDGSISVGSGTSITGLPSGSYNVLVTDDVGCTATATVTVGDLTGPSASIVATTDVLCNGGTDGTADVTATGGTGALTYNWMPGNLSGTSQTGLAANTYTVTVTDANGCSDNITVTINEPTPLTVGITASVAVSGFGLCDGSLSAAAAGGTGPYTYQWTDDSYNPIGQTSANATNLCEGTWCVIATDANGCIDTICGLVTSPNAIVGTLVGTDESCIGACDGTSTVTASGGVGPYTYQWFQGTPPGTIIPGQTAITATGLCAGIYYVQITDQNGVAANSEIVIIGSPTAITATTSVVSNYNGADVSCIGACDGSADVTAAGGTPPYSFAWYDNGAPIGQTSQVASNLCAGTYDVIITDANGCMDTVPVTLTEPTQLTNTFTVTDASCFGVADGSISTAVSGGTGPYTYQWTNNNADITPDITGELAGTYDVTITDANGCQITQSATITEPTELLLGGSSVGSNCNQADGSATTSIISGDGPFTYLWDASAGNQTTATATNLMAGCYTCYVTDNNTCIDSVVVCVLDLGSPTVVPLTVTDVSCNGGCDGFAQIQVSGGTAPYSYTWFDGGGVPIGQNTASAFNLCAGTYTGQIQDVSGCIASVSVTINEPPALQLTITSTTDVTCFGDCDGDATILATGGTGPYTYQWNDINAQTTATASNLCPGTYQVTVTDANGCQDTLSAIVGEPAEVIVATSSVDAFCGLPLGSATVTITSGGVAPFTYLWSDNQVSATAINLVPGTYTVTVTDADGCTASGSATVGDIPAGVATISGTVTVSCFGLADGSATVSMGGTGTPPYTYQWYDAGNAPLAGQVGQTAPGLAAGDYYVIVTDQNGCTSTSNMATVNEPTQLTVTTIAFDATCFGACDGSITTTTGGGNFPYTYAWNDSLNQTTVTATGLCAGPWDVTVTDDNGCTVTATGTVNQPTEIQLDSVVVNSNCGQPDGQGCVLATGGTPGYTYLWPSGGTNSCEISLPANTYLVTVTDANGCVKTIPVEIQDVNGPSAAIIAQTDVSCFGDCDGSATVDMVGGAGSTFTVLWDANAGNQTTPTAGNLCAGIYAVSITDDLGCSASANVTIVEPTAISTNPQFSNPVCFGDCNGAIWISTVGGTAPYSYNWLDATNNVTLPATGDSVAGLCAGDYILTLTDANGCVEFINYTLTDPPMVTGTISSTPATCNGDCDGTATAVGNTGQIPFTYQWDGFAGNQTTATATGLCAGTYSVTITDNDGCTVQLTTTVTEPPVLTAAINNFGDVSCAGACDGFAQVDVAGGNGSYFFNWTNNGGISQVASNLCAGLYDVTVSDQFGCSATASVTIQEPTPLVGNITTADVTCFGQCDGTAGIAVSGGTAPYQYLWTGMGIFTNTSSISNLCVGNYTVLVTDVNGCQFSQNVLISGPTALSVNATITSSNCGQANGEICVNVFGGQFPYTYQWNDPNTQTGACATNLLAQCYTLVITDGNGCTMDTLFCINDIAGPTVALTGSTDVTCAADSNGAMGMTVSGGVLPYASITWQDGGGNALPQFDGLTNINGLWGGCYAITVVDNAGCVASLQACINEPTPVTSGIVASGDASCNGICDGFATVSEFGGIPPYTYAWNDGQTTATASNLCAGNYVVTITDANGCTSQSTVTINEPAPLAMTIVSQTNVSCFGLCDGSASINATGGTAPYLYTWQNYGGSGPTASNLCADNFSVKISDAHGCIDSIPVTITEPAALVVNAVSVDASCGLANGSASVTVTGGVNPYNYDWGGLGNTPNGSVNTGLPIGGPHTILVTDGNGCVKQADVTINDQPGPVIDSIVFVAPTCNGLQNGSATVYATSPGGLAMTYLWDAAASNQNSQTAVALTAGTFCVTVTDVNGCTATQCVNVTEPALLVPIPDLDRTICFGDSTQVWANAQGGTAPYVYTWNTTPPLIGIGPHTVEPTQTTQYCFTVTDANGCQPVQGCVTITVNPELELDLTPDISICDGESLTLDALAIGGTGGPYQFNWYEGSYPNGTLVTIDTTGTASNILVTPGTNTTYYVILTDGCSLDAIDSVQVSINATPIGFINVIDSAGCAPFNAQFAANTDIGVTFDWDFDCDGIVDESGTNSAPNYTYQTPGTYSVCLTITSADGCSVSLQETNLITVYDVPIAGFFPTPEQTTLLNPTIQFLDGSVGADIYSWNFGDFSPILTGPDSAIISGTGDTTYMLSSPFHTYQDTGYFTVTQTVTNQYGCTDQATHTVYVEGDYILFAPTAFTPNGDGINDIFFPKGIGFDNNNFDMFVFDRWGEIIYEGHDATAGWDGNVKGTSMQAKVDVYVWMINTRDHRGQNHTYYGHVTVVR